MQQHEVRALLAGLREGLAQGEGLALATIVGVTGSAYRREGTKMLIRADGSYTCMLSGGCLEPEIVEAARGVVASGEPLLTRYNLDEEVMWGLGIGCGGEVEVYIEKVQPDAVTEPWWEALERGERALLVTPLEPGLGRWMISAEAEAGGLEDPALAAQVRERAKGLLEQLQPQPLTYTFHRSDGRRVRVFIDVNLPPAELVIFGAGHDAIPLVQMAVNLGFRVRVVDMRAQFAQPSRFPGAEVEVLRPEQFAARLHLDERSLAVVMNHNLLVDQSALEFVLHTPAAYVGLLGPRARFEKILEGLAREGRPLREDQIRRVRNPIGLAIGAESPEEVAVSIIAEVLAFQRGFGGGFLSGHQGRIHRPSPAAG
ncbi:MULTISPECIES: XdhC family protein [unclassified Meiothermus]|uniref:XdhC family protein n=1 Tax=unclassified Meiothermus TaxID=370471 RepID=UPI000D7BE4D5|nr:MULTISPECIES: XdhC/CoxI family protein [unclassified Meiothermus]PZA07307.1 XdhC/CoxI family protein [Meiothermus sp. Pnk-1]RYM29199.1 XdhC/CoxI family protein [Meiothermus sp. PNK-Is4]